MKKQEDLFTIVFLPGSKGRVRRLTLTRQALKSSLAVTLTVLVVSVFLALSYFQMLGKVLELESLRQETKSQRLQIQSFAVNLFDLEKQLLRLKEFDHRLQRAANLGARERSTPADARGGPATLGVELTKVGTPSAQEMMDQMRWGITRLKEEASRQEVSFQRLFEHFEDRRYQLAATPSLWPVRGRLTSHFGYRTSPFTGAIEFHSGIDIATAKGTPVHAPADGEVSAVGFNEGYGRYLEIDHGYGLRTAYGHISHTSMSVGQKVRRGQVIASVGNSGNSTGPHLHYEVRAQNVPRNPMKYIF
jgi:murein DD-endopeptidase MepM/ murein hydrolase activator NlpD